MMFISAYYWNDVSSKILDIWNKILDLSIFSVYGHRAWSCDLHFSAFLN